MTTDKQNMKKQGPLLFGGDQLWGRIHGPVAPKSMKLKLDSSGDHMFVPNFTPGSVAAAAELGNLVEVQMLRSYPRSTEPEALC